MEPVVVEEQAAVQRQWWLDVVMWTNVVKMGGEAWKWWVGKIWRGRGRGLGEGGAETGG